MNRFVTTALAGVIATASVAATLGTADAGGYWRGGTGQGYGPGQGYGQDYGQGYGHGYGPGPGNGWGPGPGPGPDQWRHHRHRDGGDWGGALAGGAILGLVLGAALAAEPPPPPPAYVYYPPPPPLRAYAYASPSLHQAHVDWCAQTYRSYRPETDTFTGYDGLAYRCVAPY